MKNLPIGIQTFRKIIEKDYLYIDKTKELFEGNQELFKELDRWIGKLLCICDITTNSNNILILHQVSLKRQLHPLYLFD